MTNLPSPSIGDIHHPAPNEPTPRMLGAMPAFAPLFVPGTEQVSVRWLSLVYPTSRAIVDAVLPGPLTTPATPEVMVWIAEFRGARFTDSAGNVETRPAYMQGGVNLRCRYDNADGAYAVETFVEGLNHGILGREMFGLPKKQVTQVEFEPTATGASFGFSDARGHRLLAGSAPVGAPTAERIAPNWFDTQYTAKLIPRADGPGYDISRLVRIPFRLDATGPLQAGTASVEWTPSASDPLHLLTRTGDASAVWGEADLAIDYGTYVADLTPADIPAFGTPRW
ncbi:acetoacetate decarboxylase family protein [Nocardia farcinica]|uniref:acetoacetate decarboxylase family protein n=1 Tax=Nocardia farcinica TaxID=37329 RepID=UPI0037961C51